MRLRESLLNYSSTCTAQLTIETVIRMVQYAFDFTSFPILQTERLILRELSPQDVTALLRHFGNPEVVRFLDIQPIRTKEQAKEWLQWMGSFYAQKEGLRWGIALKADDTLIGTAGLHGWNRESHYAEIGYDLAAPYWGEGYATEVARALVEFGWNEMNLNRIEANVVQGNMASMRVLEKLGFRQEGVMRQRLLKGGKYYDLHFFSLLRSEYIPANE